MKVAILSMQQIKNYGSFLQAFSLKKNIESLGQIGYSQPIITQYFTDNKSEIWSLSLIAHSKR